MNILALGAHPDDIEYGCAGMLTKYAQKGHAVYLFVASDGALGGDAAVRRAEQADAALVMDARAVFWGGYPDTEVPLNRDLKEGNFYSKSGRLAYFAGRSTAKEAMDQLLQVGASARERLRLAAAQKWNVPVDQVKAETAREAEKVLGAGGLYVLGTERHE